jgi:hypothetical protein
LRRRVIASAAGLSAVSAALCAASVLQGGASAARWACALSLAATLAAGAELRRRQSPPDLLRVGSAGIACAFDDGGKSGQPRPKLHPACVTAWMICLAPPGGRGEVVLWRDGVAPDGFRRLAALGLWRRGAGADPAESAELIARDAVTRTRMAPRPGWPRTE